MSPRAKQTAPRGALTATDVSTAQSLVWTRTLARMRWAYGLAQEDSSQDVLLVRALLAADGDPLAAVEHLIGQARSQEEAHENAPG